MHKVGVPLCQKELERRKDKHIGGKLQLQFKNMGQDLLYRPR